MLVKSKKAGALLLALAFAALIALSSISTVMAQGNGGKKGGSGEDEHEDVPVLLTCSLGYKMLDQYKWEEESYVPNTTSGENVSVDGTKKEGTFTVINTDKLVYEVVLLGVGKDNIARDAYPTGVTSGSFNDSKINPGQGQGPGVKYVAFCGKNAPITPAEVTFVAPTCEALGTYTVPTTINVVYMIGDKEVPAGTYTANNGTTVTVTAEALEDFELEGTTNWSKTFTAPTDCDDDGDVLDNNTVAVVTPAPTTPTSLPNTGNSVATIVALMTALSAGAAMFSTTLRSALIKFNS